MPARKPAATVRPGSVSHLLPRFFEAIDFPGFQVSANKNLANGVARFSEIDKDRPPLLRGDKRGVQAFI
jgi:hypothetical protein